MQAITFHISNANKNQIDKLSIKIIQICSNTRYKNLSQYYTYRSTTGPKDIIYDPYKS